MFAKKTKGVKCKYSGIIVTKYNRHKAINNVNICNGKRFEEHMCIKDTKMVL